MTVLLVILAVVFLLATAVVRFQIFRDVRRKGNALAGDQGPSRQRASLIILVTAIILFAIAALLQMSGVGK